jgi:hypothetical protein
MRHLITFLLLSVSLGATVIVQKNGDVISGRILEEKPDKYIFQSPYGKLNIAKANVSKMILDEKKIELTEIRYKDKVVKARLVAQQDNKSVYLTDDGRTIRTESDAKPAEAQVRRDNFLLSLSGSYGWSTFQKVFTPQSPGSTLPFDQSIGTDTLGAQASGHYILSGYFGAGLNGSVYRWSGTATVPQPGTPPDFEAKTAHMSLFVAPSAVVSLLGHLGSHTNSHDLRLELQPGIASNTASIDFAFTPPLNGFPSSAQAKGNATAFALQAHLYYCYSVTESLRLRFGGAYYRVFYDQVFDGKLQNGEAIPGGFTADVEGSLANKAGNPQVMSLTLGVELGF